MIAERRWVMAPEVEAAEAVRLCSFFVTAFSKEAPADVVKRLTAAILKANVRVIRETRYPPSVVCADYNHPCGGSRR
jgi:hypothetical protein